MAQQKIFGYANRISVRSGEEITFHVNCDGAAEAAEHQRVFDSAAAALCSGGLMVLDFLNAALVRTQPLLPQVHSLQGITFDVTKHLEASRIIKTIRIRDGNGRQEFTESVELLEKDELCAMAQNSNLQECYCFGDYDLQPFNGNASPRLILIFKSDL